MSTDQAKQHSDAPSISTTEASADESSKVKVEDNEITNQNVTDDVPVGQGGGASANVDAPIKQEDTDATEPTKVSLAAVEILTNSTPGNISAGNFINPSQQPTGMTATPTPQQSNSFVTGRKTFPGKLYDILADESYCLIISWMPHGRSWKVHDPSKFEKSVMPIFFQQTKYASFARQVTGWGFKRITANGPDRNSYFHELFIRSDPQLISKMKRPVKKRVDVGPKPGESSFFQDSQTLAAMGMGRGIQPQYQFLAQDPNMLALQGGVTGLAYQPHQATLTGMPGNQQMFTNVTGGDPRFQGYSGISAGLMGGFGSNLYGFTGANPMMNGSIGMPMFDNNMLSNQANFPSAGAEMMLNPQQRMQLLQQGQGNPTQGDSQQQHEQVQQQSISPSQQQHQDQHFVLPQMNFQQQMQLVQQQMNPMQQQLHLVQQQMQPAQQHEPQHQHASATASSNQPEDK